LLLALLALPALIDLRPGAVSLGEVLAHLLLHLTFLLQDFLALLDLRPSTLCVGETGEVLAHLLEYLTFLLLALLTLLDLRPGALGVGEVLAHLLEHLHVRATSAHTPSVTF
jgi:hypothetical protein